MMKVVGEEGVSTQEFVDYLKGDFFDAVYLQQNAFDKTDEATAADRQKHVYRLITEIIDRNSSREQRRRPPVLPAIAAIVRQLELGGVPIRRF